MTGMDSDVSFMAQCGERLIDSGYSVIPIMPGTKVPGRFTGGEWSPYPNWTRHCDRPTKGFEVDIWQRWPGCGVGIATGSVVGIDIDILDGELAIQLAALATTMLGDTPCLRIGRAPKRLLVYRTETPFAGRKRLPLEVLAHGQQFVAYAIHPGTGQPYEWPEDGLLDMPLEKLPAVTEAQVMAWLDQAYAMIPAELRPHTLIGDRERPGTWRGPSDPRGTYEAVQAALAFMPNDDLDGHSWITMGNAIKAALGDQGKDLWLAWSRQSSKSGASGRTDTPERHWATLRPHSIGAGSIYTMADRSGLGPAPGDHPQRRCRRAGQAAASRGGDASRGRCHAAASSRGGPSCCGVPGEARRPPVGNSRPRHSTCRPPFCSPAACADAGRGTSAPRRGHSRSSPSALRSAPSASLPGSNPDTHGPPNQHLRHRCGGKRWRQGPRTRGDPALLRSG